MELSIAARLRLCVEKKPESCGFVIFGASGDLTARKLLPSLFNLHARKLLPESFFILGCARSPLDSEAFRRQAAGVAQSHVEAISGAPTQSRCFAADRSRALCRNRY